MGNAFSFVALTLGGRSGKWASLFLFLVASAANAFAQGPAPFWGPLPGPQGAPLYINFLLNDSTISTVSGGTIYVYDSSINRWVPAGSSENKPVWQQQAAVYLPVPASYWLPPLLVYASYEDTLFVTTDSGLHWRVVGTFGTHPPKFSYAAQPIVDLIETETRVVLIDDSNRLYSTADTFKTIDTEQMPETARTISNILDTLYLWSVHGNLFRSPDFGKTWREVFGMNDTGSNWYGVLKQSGDTEVLGFFQQSTVFPWGDTNLHLAYSFDAGNSWEDMSAPVSNKSPYFCGPDDRGHLYAIFEVNDYSVYRTDDWGKTWHKLSVSTPYLHVEPAGTLYAGNNLRSTDLGETWDSLSVAGAACLPLDMISFHNTTVLSAAPNIYSSVDNGQSWPILSYGKSAVFSIRPDSGQLMLNTTQMLNQNGGAVSLCWPNNSQVSGRGVITSGFHVWLAQSGWTTERSVWDTSGRGSWVGSSSQWSAMLESTDGGCSYASFSYDTLSPTPIVRVMEWAHDTILAVSQSGVYRGYDILIPFDTVTPELGTASPTGAMMKDSSGAIYIAMSDGKLFVTTDGANSWSEFASPESDASAPIISMSASPNGLLFAVDSNLSTGYTRTWQYDPTKEQWQNVTSGLKRPGFSDTAIVTNVWYVNGYAYAGTWNMGLFRSQKPVGPVSSVSAAERSSPLKLYPDPASGAVTLAYPASVKGSYRIDDIAGREVLRGALPNSGSVTIDLHSVPAGMYEVTVGTSPWAPVKLVVEH